MLTPVEFKLGFGIDNRFTICCDGNDRTFPEARELIRGGSPMPFVLRFGSYQHQGLGSGNYNICVSDHGSDLIAYPFMVLNDMLYQSFIGLGHEKASLAVDVTLLSGICAQGDCTIE